MSSEIHRVVLNRRRGREFNQLVIDKEAPLIRRIGVTAEYFDVEMFEIIKLAEGVRNVLIDEPESALTSNQSYNNQGRTFFNFFQGQFRDLGISEAHSRNLVIGVVDHLALKVSPRNTMEWFRERSKSFDKLRQKISYFDFRMPNR